MTMNPNARPTGNQPPSTQPRKRRSAPRWPAISALLIIGGIYLIISNQFSLGPRWLILAVVLIAIVPINLARLKGLHHISRVLALVTIAVVTIAVMISATFLIIHLPQRTPGPRALALLRDAALIWIANVLIFALWYWEIDGGGPMQRHMCGYSSTDFIFPQMTKINETQQRWTPTLIDYLFLAFNTSTAFSPTDTMVLSRRAKLLMMLQALISLAVIAVLAARAINTL